MLALQAPGAASLRTDNPPTNQELLLCLQRQLIAERRCSQAELSWKDHISDGKRITVKTEAKI